MSAPRILLQGEGPARRPNGTSAEWAMCTPNRGIGAQGLDTCPYTDVLRYRRFIRARSRDGAPVLQATCSGPPTDSPSGWPRCQRSPGRMKPPTSSPSTSSARRQAEPRAQRTQPCATTGSSRLRLPRWSGRVYFASSGFRPSRMHRREQKRWFTACAVKSFQQWSHRRWPKLGGTPRRNPAGRLALHPGQSRQFPWPAKNSREQRLQDFLTMNPRRLRGARAHSGGYGIGAGWVMCSRV